MKEADVPGLKWYSKHHPITDNNSTPTFVNPLQY